MKRGKFISILVEALIAAGETTYDLMIRESMQQKILRMGGFDPKTISRNFNNLRYRGILKRDRKGYRFTKKGKRWRAWAFEQYLGPDFIRKKSWDYKWRIIIFDIPEQFKKKRGYLRTRLKYLGFTALQKSVFVSPYQCEESIGYVVERLGLHNFVDLIIAESIGTKELLLRKKYGLQKMAGNKKEVSRRIGKKEDKRRSKMEKLKRKKKKRKEMYLYNVRSPVV